MPELLTGIITTDVSFALIACNFDWVIVVDIFVALEQVPSYTRYNKNCINAMGGCHAAEVESHNDALDDDADDMLAGKN